MTRGFRRLLGVVGCLLGGLWPCCGHAQVRALPPIVAPPEQGLVQPEFETFVRQPELVLSPVDDDPIEAAVWQEQPIGFSTSEATEQWRSQFLPQGLLYPNYLADRKAARMASQWTFDFRRGWFWDVSLGGRVGILRFGSDDPVYPEGWQIDVAGAAFPRLDLEDHWNLVSTDFHFGVPLTFRQGPWEGKLAYEHLSAHAGDEFLLANPGFRRINFSRDAIVLGLAVRPVMPLRLYAEAGWAFHTDGGCRPWQFQFGAEWSDLAPTGPDGAPFLAAHGSLRQEVDFGGNVTLQTGWQWRTASGSLLRAGVEYFNGKSLQYEFFNQFEESLGLAFWYDF